MAHTHSAHLLDFAATCRVSIEKYDQDTACKRIVKYLGQQLFNPQFLKACFGAADWEGRKIIYADDQFGFCICAHITHITHINSVQKETPPHNHGPSWAIYGQAAGHTEMTDWELTAPVNKEPLGKVQKLRTYPLNPGDVHYYPAGAIHSLLRAQPGRLIRIEGQNFDHLERSTFEPENP
ncbi:hypothetical protein [Parendozoicomonas sp. Alg238-R29]|uniref:hypothetical protein n=1 Tax=Parendozoicomonas sp. Alg238-R29 TaxID=2993446 RepID=UPI00248D63EE|nr:hypothetical protein [Parendozoicomonas sp. Alg238-R29]